jgi:hypothetical protein
MEEGMQVLTPFERSTLGLVEMMAGVCESVSVDAAVKSALAEEAAMAHLGQGVPPLTETVRLHIMWGGLAEFSIPGEH